MDFPQLDISALAIACIALVLLYLYWTWDNSYSNIPGPGWGLPIFGHSYLLSSQPHLALAEMQKKYGDVFKIKMGPHTAVVISGKDAIKESCHLSAFVGRPHKLFHSWSKHDRYFAFGHSQASLRYRKAAIKSVATFTNDNLQQAVEDIADELVNFLCAEKDGKHQNDQIRASTADISYLMCFGEKGKARNDEEFAQVIASLNNILSFARTAGLADMFPWALYLPSINRKYQLYLEAQNKLIELVRRQEERHKLSKQIANGTESNKKANDLCDLLSESVSAGELKELRIADPNIGSLSEQTGMLLVAGYETVAVSLTWAIVLLATHPEAQERIWKQLTNTDNCELLDAFILESLRFSMASPLGMPHMTTNSATVCSYQIPKDTLILVNLWTGSRDGRVWGANADQFDPYRFITASTGQINSSLADHLMAFGSGRRRCVGEKLAKAEIQLFLIHMIKKCRISLADEKEKVDYWSNAKNGRNVPPIVNMKFIRRQ